MRDKLKELVDTLIHEIETDDRDTVLCRHRLAEEDNINKDRIAYHVKRYDVIGGFVVSRQEVALFIFHT